MILNSGNWTHLISIHLLELDHHIAEGFALQVLQARASPLCSLHWSTKKSDTFQTVLNPEPKM